MGTTQSRNLHKRDSGKHWVAEPPVVSDPRSPSHHVERTPTQTKQVPIDPRSPSSQVPRTPVAMIADTDPRSPSCCRTPITSSITCEDSPYQTPVRGRREKKHSRIQRVTDKENESFQLNTQ
mmetsp:Transcript_25063/g.31886  ORF Transcript_25063/g.31886 Transcript_25063/m.31886 type:complete len:122 (+) Transcript_25063:1296-1661(+)